MKKQKEEKIITLNTNVKVKCVTDWIKMKFKKVSFSNPLYDYSDTGILTYFNYNGKCHAIEEYTRSHRIQYFINENKKITFLYGYNSQNLLIEIYGDAIRIYEKI